MKILHICFASPIINDFIKLIKDGFISTEHFFIIIGNNCNSNQKNLDNILWYDFFDLKKDFINSISNTIDLVKKIFVAKKVILHGLFFPNFLLCVLALIPSLYNKCYWVIWGGDLYDHILQKNSLRRAFYFFIKRIMCRKIGHVLTYIKGDYELAKKWYRINAQYHECIMYPSNFYKDMEELPKNSTTLNILMGNSANPSNNHKEILDKLRQYKNWDIKIYAPLSYGGKETYVKEIEQYGKNLFGDKFESLTGFIPLKEYNKFLANIDVAIFAYKRQQGMGNILSLLGMGKMVFIRSSTTLYQMFKELGIKIYSFENLSLSTKDNLPYLNKNRDIIKNNFNKEILIKQLTKIFK